MSWRQIFLVLKREYMTRIKSKGFIAATLLVPIGIIVFYGVAILIIVWDSDASYQIGVKDDTGVIVRMLQEMDEERYLNLSELSVDSLRTLVQESEITGYVMVTDENIDNGKNLELIYSGTGGLTLLASVRSDFREAVRQERLKRAEVTQEIQDIFQSRVALDSRRLTAEGEETDDDTAFLSGIGFAMGLVIFIAIFGYGGYIMRGVIEEKTNRIVEVITSSVKPIELLTGKMAGVAALAVTQLGIWALTITGLGLLATPLIMMFMNNQTTDLPDESAEAGLEALGFSGIPTIETSLIVYFIIFFFLGYLLYSSLFAAIGSAADSETDTQQLMLPIIAPIMIAYFILFQATQNPDSTVAVVGSLIPFFAPIVMVSRIAITDVPFWQVGLSILLMVLTFAGTMWLSAKIYKVGILSYGKTAGFKDLARWIRQ